MNAVALEGKVKDFLIGFEELFGQDYDASLDMKDMAELMAVATELDGQDRLLEGSAHDLVRLTGNSLALEAYYSPAPPFKKKALAMESVYESIKTTGKMIITKIIEFFKRVIAWLRGLIPGQGITERKVRQMEEAIKQFKEHSFNHAIRDQAIRGQAEKLAKESLTQTFSQKVNSIQWDILDRGERNTAILALSKLLLKEDPVTELSEAGEKINGVYEQLARQSKAVDEKSPIDNGELVDFKAKVADEFSDNFAQPLLFISSNIEGGLSKVNDTTNKLKEDNKRQLDANVSMLIDIIDKRLHDFDYHVVAKNAIVASDRLEKILGKITKYQAELDETAPTKNGVVQPGIAFVRRQYLGALMEMLSLSKNCMRAYKHVSDQFVYTIQLFVTCQEYFMGVYRRMLHETTALNSDEVQEIKEIIEKMTTSNRLLREFF